MPKQKLTEADRKLEALKQRWQRAKAQQANAAVLSKKKSKPVGYKLQNTFEKNLQGVPGGSMSRGVTAATIKMVAAKHTGTKVRAEGIGLLRSARNANTTQGSYFTSIVRDETGQIVSDRQGRKEFGR